MREKTNKGDQKILFGSNMNESLFAEEIFYAPEVSIERSFQQWQRREDPYGDAART
jgi:hypothetical protein